MKTLPFGTWPSPITPDTIVAETVRLASVSLDTGRIGWLEGRPGEGGRNVLVRANDAGGRDDVTPPPFNVRSRVHEYGGGAYAVSGDRIWFSNFEDGRIYAQTGTAAAGAPDRGRPGPVRGPDRRSGTAAPCSRCARRIATARRRPTTWSRYPSTTARCGCSPRGMTSSRRRHPAPTDGGLRGSPGTSRTCPGTRRRCGWPSLTGTACQGRRSESRAGRAARRFSRRGRPTVPCGASSTRKDGGISTVGATASSGACIAPNPSSASPCGSSGRPRSMSTRADAWYARGAAMVSGGWGASTRTAR